MNEWMNEHTIMFLSCIYTNFYSNCNLQTSRKPASYSAYTGVPVQPKRKHRRQSKKSPGYWCRQSTSSQNQQALNQYLIMYLIYNPLLVKLSDIKDCPEITFCNYCRFISCNIQFLYKFVSTWLYMYP